MRQLFTCTLGSRTTVVTHIASTGEIPSSARNLWVCDEHTECHLPENVEALVLPPGEDAKRWEGIEMIISAAFKRDLGRDGHIIAVGGGVVCDMAAFAASIYMRGCAVSLVPTTVLAMVDASLGGKSAIDLFGAKNLVGTFHPAKEVFICVPTLATLDDRGFKNGLGEVLKHALLAQDESLLEFLECERDSILRRDREAVQRMVIDSLRVKQAYVEADPTESRGIRDALNLGHTFAHALESVGNLSRWSHGEAVAWGMVRALRAGVALGFTPSHLADRYEKLVASYGFDTSYQVEDTSRFLDALRHDKKKRDSHIRFVLMERQGSHILATLENSLVISLVKGE